MTMRAFALGSPRTWCRRSSALSSAAQVAASVSSPGPIPWCIGWSAAATALAAVLAPATPRDTMPATGVPGMPLPSSPSEQWFGADSAELPKVAFAGRLTKQKGIADALGALDDLRRQMPIHVAIAGIGPLQSLVEEWVAQRPEAHFHGLLSRERVIDMFAAADVVLLPSISIPSVVEQFGKVAVEVMAVGTHVIAYDSGALPEVVGDGGILVTEGDRGRLAAAMGDFFAAPPARRAGLIAAAGAQATRFTDQVLAERLLHLWRTVTVDSAPGIQTQTSRSSAREYEHRRGS